MKIKVGDKVRTKKGYKAWGKTTDIEAGAEGVVDTVDLDRMNIWPIVVNFGDHIGVFDEDELEIL